jgi:hypothetical protein
VFSKEFNESSQSVAVLPSHKEHQTEESARPFTREPANSRSYQAPTSKKMLSKAQLIFKQLGSSLDLPLPKIEFISMEAYRSMSESDKLKLDKELREHFEKQIPLEDRIRKEMSENIKRDSNWASEKAS